MGVIRLETTTKCQYKILRPGKEAVSSLSFNLSTFPLSDVLGAHSGPRCMKVPRLTEPNSSSVKSEGCALPLSNYLGTQRLILDITVFANT